MKVPIEGKDKRAGIVGSPEPAEAVSEGGKTGGEQARVEAAIRAGEEAAEREIAEEASRARQERDELQQSLDDMEGEVEAAKAEAAESANRLARLQADWDNYRKRIATERLAERERASERLVSNLLPVVDDIERAIDHAGAVEGGDTQMQQFVDGVSAVRTKMLGVLQKEGVEVIDPVGDAFDPLEHQAVGRVDDESQYDETVAQVYQKGYRMGGKVIRTAMVTVTFGGEKRPAPEDVSGADARE